MVRACLLSRALSKELPCEARFPTFGLRVRESEDVVSKLAI